MRWAAGPKPTPERLVRAGLVALALLALGEAAPAATLVDVSVEAHGSMLSVSVDGQSHEVQAAVRPWRRVELSQPGPLEREYQVDGSDVTSSMDRRPEVVLGFVDTPLYPLLSWLRDEASYSRWDDARVTDLATGAAVEPGAPLPEDFRVQAALRRPEAAAHLWLVSQDPREREGLELDRDKRNARWVVVRGAPAEPMPRWFFPEQAAPFAAEALHLLGRSAAAGFGLLVITIGVAAVLGPGEVPLARRMRDGRAGDPLLAAWFVGASLLTARLYHQLPHILDAVSYTFQAGAFVQGEAARPAPPLALLPALKGPFQVVFEQRWFSQYPPGTPAAYAVGKLAGVDWLVGPAACAAMIGATSWVAGRVFGPRTGFAALVLGLLSPLVLFQSGSFLSHPIAGGLLGCALAAYVAAVTGRRARWFVACGALLGASFLTREAATVLFAAPLGVRLLWLRNWRGLAVIVLAGLPFVGLYLAYNTALTGSPLVLPRSLFDPSDHFGFGDGVGFYARHTLAAGLANMDEQLTLLQFDAFGWPPLALFGMVAVSALLARLREWEALALAGLLLFVVGYVGYFYHGIALGPRYYFEALPWLVLLTARGAQRLAHAAGNRIAAAAVLGALCLYCALFYLPLEVQRRVDFSAYPNGRPLGLPFVRTTLTGPRLEGVPSPALVLVGDWWLYNTGLAALNCPAVPDCEVVFALTLSPLDVQTVRAAFPNRTVLRVVNTGAQLVLQPVGDEG